MNLKRKYYDSEKMVKIGIFINNSNENFFDFDYLVDFAGDCKSEEDVNNYFSNLIKPLITFPDENIDNFLSCSFVILSSKNMEDYTNEVIEVLPGDSKCAGETYLKDLEYKKEYGAIIGDPHKIKFSLIGFYKQKRSNDDVVGKLHDYAILKIKEGVHLLWRVEENEEDEPHLRRIQII